MPLPTPVDGYEEVVELLAKSLGQGQVDLKLLLAMTNDDIDDANDDRNGSEVTLTTVICLHHYHAQEY